jgi:hypothetical protein
MRQEFQNESGLLCGEMAWMTAGAGMLPLEG